MFQALDGGVEPALVAAAVTLTYRVIAAIAYRGRELVRVMAEEVPASELRYVVPFEARSRYVGGDYVEQLAKARGGTFRRNPPDVGILASLDSLEGPTFDPSRVHPLIREFYEHTSRFRLSIIPEWRRWMKPGYELFKLVVAEPLGQAAIPSNIEEAQRGMVSTIDTITLDGDDEIDIRGWIRTFADSGKPIYVGIYTSFRHDDRGYVSVGFPIPSANFTATLLPRNAGEHDFVLTSRTDLEFPGHYLSSVDSERDALTVLKLLYFQERDLRLRRRRRAEDRPQLLPGRPAVPDSPLRDRAPRRIGGARAVRRQVAGPQVFARPCVMQNVGRLLQEQLRVLRRLTASPLRRAAIAFLTGALMVSCAWAGASLAPVPAGDSGGANATAAAPAPGGPIDPASLPEGQVLAGAAKTSIAPRPADYGGTWETRREQVRDAQRRAASRASSTTPSRRATTSPPPARRGPRTRTASTWAASGSAR